MVLTPVQSVSLSDQVFEQLATAILGGRYVAGSALPAERKLVAMFGVNRHVVREALKRLEQLHLVRISQGGSTRVLDFRATAGLDLLALLADYARFEPASMGYWLGVLEMRLALGADAARLCARRASPEVRAELRELARAMREANDDGALFELEIRFWHTVLRGGDNLAYRLAFNTLLRAIASDKIALMVRPALVQEVKLSDFRAHIAEAIGTGDAEGAERFARESLGRPVALLEPLLAASAKAVALAPPASAAQPVEIQRVGDSRPAKKRAAKKA